MERSLGCNHNARGASAAVSRHRDLLHNPLAAGGAQGFASARGQFPAGFHGSAPAHALAFCRASLFPELLSHLLALLQARAFCSLRDVAPLVGARADAGLILSTPTFNPVDCSFRVIGKAMRLVSEMQNTIHVISVVAVDDP